MEWRTTPPVCTPEKDEQGWYWVSAMGNLIRVVEVYQHDDGELYVTGGGSYTCPLKESKYKYWWGPLDEPPLPKE